jgi:hypothetical protein
MRLEKTMNSMSWTFANATDGVRSTAAGKYEILTDYRARLAMEEEARVQQRRLDLAEQSSAANAPEARIRAWEKVHGLRMPSKLEHAILDVIALDTRLGLSAVQDVQTARKQRTEKAASTALLAEEIPDLAEEIPVAIASIIEPEYR